MFKEFKEFAMKGNMLDLAIGVVLGAAFGAVINSLVADLITPLIGLIGGKDFSNMFLVLRDGATAGPYATLAAAKAAGAVTVNLGVFLNVLINFLIIAFALFFVVKAVNRLRKPAEAVAAGPTDVELLAEIRDLLKKG